MAKDTEHNIKLGLFVIVGATVLIASLYIIGNKQNLFGNTIRISAKFQTVNGLMVGNNVRFAGIDVGTVEKIDIINDSTVNVVLIIEEKTRKFIKKNSLASVGTDGLMGNKLVNIKSEPGNYPPVVSGDFIQSTIPIETEEMTRTLNTTNENIKVISDNLRTLTDRINKDNTLWSLLRDTSLAENVKVTLVNIRRISNESAVITGDLRDITSFVKSGKGSIGALLTDTTISSNISQVTVKLKSLSDTAAVVTGNLSSIISNVKNGKGTVGVLLNDTTLIHNLNQTMLNLRSGSEKLDVNMEALQHNILLRRYFKKKVKKEVK